MHELDMYAFELPGVVEFFSGDTRVLAFTVVDDAGNTVDIDNADISWRLFERDYEDDPADAVLDSATDSDVELRDSVTVDPTQGEFEVRLDASASDDLWGEFYHRPKVVMPDDSTASWRGEVVITA